MSLFPLYVNLSEKDCLVIGGGQKALEKCEQLLKYGARVTVLAETICEELEALAEKSELILMREAYYPRVLDEQAMIVVTTDDFLFNHSVSMDAKTARIPVNVVGQKKDSTFLFSEDEDLQNE